MQHCANCRVHQSCRTRVRFLEDLDSKAKDLDLNGEDLDLDLKGEDLELGL